MKKRVAEVGPKKSVNNVLFSEVTPKQSRDEMLGVVNDLESTTTVKIVSGYRRRVPASNADCASARAMSETNDYRANSHHEKKKFERAAFNTTKMMGVDVSAFLRAYGVWMNHVWKTKSGF